MELLIYLNIFLRKYIFDYFIEYNYDFRWKYKIYFDYILLNNHRLSTVIFPSIQTRLYITVTILMQIRKLRVILIYIHLLSYFSWSYSSINT